MLINTKVVTRAFWSLLILLICGLHPDAQAATGGGMAENIKPPLQIVNQTGLKIVIQVNNTDTIPKGINKQVLAAKNLFDQYQTLGMKSGKDYEILMVFRGDGAQFLLNDAAYVEKVKQSQAAGNPNTAILLALHKGGVKMYECHVAMKMKGYVPEDLQPFSRIVSSGIGALVDFEKSGYLPITP